MKAVSFFSGGGVNFEAHHASIGGKPGLGQRKAGRTKGKRGVVPEGGFDVERNSGVCRQGLHAQ